MKRTPLGSTASCDHVGIVVRDMGEALAWYDHVLGAELISSFPLADNSGKGALVRVGKCRLELLEINASVGSGATGEALLRQRGINHLCFTVDDLIATTSELKSRGVKFVWDPRDMPDLGLRIALFEDLDGNLLELWQTLEPQTP